MSFAAAFNGLVRTLLIAFATAAAAFGLLVVFHPFAPAPVASVAAPVDTATADALHSRIDAVRAALTQTETALANVNTGAPAPASSETDATLRAQYEAQIAAAMERRDLARRHAAAIRDGLKTGLPLSALAEIRDSVVIGQLLSQQAALEGQIALESARLRAGHPIMRALDAQRDGLALQIRQQATGIAAALEAEADLDEAQIELLQSKLGTAESPAATPDTSALEAQANAERAELDSLMDAYFALRPATGVTATSAASPLSVPNLWVIAIASLAAVIFQIAMALRRRRVARAADLEAWQADHDAETPAVAPAAAEPEPALRRAS